MNRNELLEEMRTTRVISGNNGNGFIDISNATTPVLDGLTTLLAAKAKEVGKVDCFFGQPEYPYLSKRVSMFWNNAMVYYPEMGLDFPASLSANKDSNIVVLKDLIDTPDVKEAVDFSKCINKVGGPSHRVSVLAPFDLRRKPYDPGIDVLTIFPRKDLFF